jgi:LysM domain
MSRRVPPLLALTGLVTAEVLAVVTLHGLARIDGLGGPGTDPVGWLRTASSEDAVAGSLRLVALALAWWLLLSTAAYALAGLARVPALVRVSGVVALPGIRRCVQRALAASFLTSATLTGGISVAGAGESPPTRTVEVRDGRAIEAVPDLSPTPPTTTPPPAPPAPDPPPVPAEPPRQHVVAPGDSLWTIAVRQVADDGDVTPYWTRLVDANRHTLRSGNPNLIHPGEVVELPPLA